MANEPRGPDEDGSRRDPQEELTALLRDAAHWSETLAGRRPPRPTGAPSWWDDEEAPPDLVGRLMHHPAEEDAAG